MIRRATFSLIELSVVVAVFALLMSLLSPSLKHTVAYAHLLGCKNNLKAVGVGFHNFASDHSESLPYASYGNNPNDVNDGWDDHIQPYFDKPALTKDEHNSRYMVKSKSIDELQCPSSIVGDTILIRETEYSTLNYFMPNRTWAQSDGQYIGNATTGINAIRQPDYRPMASIPSTQGTLLLAESDVNFRLCVQGNGRIVRSPFNQIHEQSYGTGVLGISNRINYTLDMHLNFENNFLFVDGHVESDYYESTSIIGDGTVYRPEGAWTVTSND